VYIIVGKVILVSIAVKEAHEGVWQLSD